MKVCFVTNVYPPTYIGGPGEVVFNLQRYFLEKGEEAFVLTCGANDPRFPFTIRTPGGKRLFPALSPFYFFKKLYKQRFDVINFHLESGMGLAPFLWIDPKTRIVTTLHTEHLIEGQPTIEERIIKNFFVPIKLVGTYMDLHVSDEIIAVSQKTKQDYLRQRQLSKDKIRVIYNGVDSEAFSPNVSGEEIRAKYSFSGSQVILLVGSGIVLKGIIFLLQAIKELIKTHSSVKLLIVGIERKHLTEIKQRITILGLNENVSLVGQIPNRELPFYYSACDLVVLTSLSENFPVVALEAMASGKPIIASKVGGIPEMIKNYENGILVEPANVGELFNALLYVLDNPAVGVQMGFEGRKTIERRFDWKIIGQEYWKTFDSLL